MTLCLSILALWGLKKQVLALEEKDKGGRKFWKSARDNPDPEGFGDSAAKHQYLLIFMEHTITVLHVSIMTWYLIYFPGMRYWK